MGLDEKVEVSTSLPEKITAPIKKGDVIGTAAVTYGEESFAIQLLAATDVEEKPVNIIVDSSDKESTAAAYMDLATKILLVISVLIFIAFIVLVIKRNRKTK